MVDRLVLAGDFYTLAHAQKVRVALASWRSATRAPMPCSASMRCLLLRAMLLSASGPRCTVQMKLFQAALEHRKSITITTDEAKALKEECVVVASSLTMLEFIASMLPVSLRCVP